MAAKPAAPKKTKRLYLRNEDRRQMLLEKAAEQVEEQGWASLGMVSLAERAGVTRQLVYQHFPNLQKLLSKTAWFIFNDIIEQTRASIASAPDDLARAIHQAEIVTLDMPEGRGDALWQLIAGTAGGGPEMQAIRQGIRELIEATWAPAVQRALQLPEAQARAAGWMLVMAFWGMRQRVREGSMSREEGLATFELLTQRLLEAAPDQSRG